MTDTTQFTILGLRPDTTYEVKMSAINGKGEGESSAARTFKTEPVRKSRPLSFLFLLWNLEAFTFFQPRQENHCCFIISPGFCVSFVSGYVCVSMRVFVLLMVSRSVSELRLRCPGDLVNEAAL